MHADVFANSSCDLRKKFDNLEGENEFWLSIVNDYSDEYVRNNQMGKVEEQILLGVPTNVRGMVYLKTMQVKTCMDSTSYNSFVKRAKLASFESGDQFLSFEPELSQIMQVYEYCLLETSPAVAPALSKTVNKFITGAAPLIMAIEGLEAPETLAILLKLTSVYSRLTKEEYYYKSNRALEDLVNDEFVHITKQGIDLTKLYQEILTAFFLSKASIETLRSVLDLLIFEGFDFLIRLTCAKFQEEKDAISALSGDKLAEYLFAESFINSVSLDTLQQSLKVELPIVKYENEFHLMNANTINDNELTNLKETNHDLALKIAELRKKSENLKKTHDEILTQSQEYSTKLGDAETKRINLGELRTSLEEKYAQLTMQENLTNTIKANRDISKGNSELELQISEMEKKIESKRAKLAKAAKA